MNSNSYNLAQPPSVFAELNLKPSLDFGKVLVSGASGYVGGRLVTELLTAGYQVRAMVRADPDTFKAKWQGAEVIEADALDLEKLQTALTGIHTAYYLIHSLLLGPREFEICDIKAAYNFRVAAAQAGVERIIYLGGLGDTNSDLSNHLRSRAEVAHILQEGPVPVTVLRAAIIIGSGSASYEIMHHLVRKLYIIPMPVWANNYCQPIAIRDVLKYLIAILEIPGTYNRSFDIGSDDILTYREMIKSFADTLQLKRLLVVTPISSASIFAYFASLITPLPAAITKTLLQGIKNEVVCRGQDIKQFVNFPKIAFRESIIRALNREQQDKVSTRWSDAYPPAHELSIKLREIIHQKHYSTTFELITHKDSSSLFQSICHIGGKAGWFRSNWMWRLRGMIDRILMGIGSLRGRKQSDTLMVNDVIDFWRVEDLQSNQRLLLRAEMKLPGKAWLEFNIINQLEIRKLQVSAYFFTDSFLGKLYWYSFLPFHRYIFYDLINGINKRA